MKRTKLLLTILSLILSFSLFGQGWEGAYGGTSVDIGYSVLQTANGDFISCGNSSSFGNTLQDVYLVRTDVDGNLIWETTHGSSSASEFAYSMLETSDGNYLVAGYTTKNANEDIFLLKFDADGDTLWTSVIEGPGDERGFRVIETADNGFAIAGQTVDLLNNVDIYVVKTDSNGDLDWSRRYEEENFDAAYSLLELPGEGYMLAGYQTISGVKEAVLKKINLLGDPLDLYPLGQATFNSSAEILPTTNGYIVAAYSGNAMVIRKVNEDGMIIWTTDAIPDFFMSIGPSMVETPDGGYALVGDNNDSDLKIVKTDNGGLIEWFNTLGSPIDSDAGRGVCNVAGSGYGIVGVTESFGAGSRDLYLLKTDGSGNTLNNFIAGNVFYDLNENCDFEAGEFGLNDWLLEVDGDNTTYYGLTDEDGNYQIAVEAGDYTLSLIPLNDYWQSCVAPSNLSLSGTYDTVVVDFPLQAVYDCPLMEVDISTPFLRRCFDNQYTVTYCNDGTSLAEDAYVEVELDSFLIFDNASIAFSNVGNLYTFELGDIDVGVCGEFYIDVTVDCDSTILGQTHCVEAHIFPDSICTPPQQCWDGGSVELDASCDGDTVHFTVKNVGNAEINEVLNYIIIEDFVILNTDQIDDPILPGGSRTISQSVAGQMLRIEVDQVACHPGNSTPTVSVEGCGLLDPQDADLGYLTEYYQDDSNPFVSIDCQENIGSWDPNDKRGFPKGYEDQHYIEANQELDYIIRFQNTGSDTAFRVVIRDTISEWLDIRDVQVGASSHPFDYEIYQENILKFTFYDINLPDSTTNEVESHGFVKFRIAQQLDNPLETVIPNSAAIYFDYNEPVITNETWHTIGKDFITIIDNVEDQFESGVYIRHYPNPFKEETTFEIVDDQGMIIPDFTTKTFHLFDPQGRLIRSEVFDGNQFQFLRKGLAPGLYFFEIEDKNKLIIGGKLIAH